MRQDRLFGWATAVGTALVLILALAAPASARKFQMTGTWAIRNGQVFIPLQFAGTLGGSQMTMTSLGNLSKGFFFPNGPIPGFGGVTATGMTPATLMVPQHRFQMNPAAAVPLAGVTLVQITTMFTVDAPFAMASLMAGGGPGAFAWCPNSTLSCPVTGLPNGGTRNGRIIYSAGANQFGGTMQMGLGNGGINSFLFNAVPFQVGHVYFGGTGTTIRNLAPGRGTPANPWTEMVYLVPGVVTIPVIPPTPNGLVLFPGPKLTTGGGNTATMGMTMTFMLPPIGFSTMGMSAGQITSNYGFAHTTGTIIGQQSVGTGGDDFFTFDGNDARTPLGAGNISTVAGGISFRNTLAGQTPYISMHKVWMSLGAPIPSMSPAGFAAAGALMLLAVGYALRRRLP